MKNIITRLTLPCRHVTRIIAGPRQTLSSMVNAKFQTHLFFCEECRLYAAQLRSIREGHQRMPEKPEQPVSDTTELHEQTKPRQREVLKLRKK
ncbi:hypothetical protein W02_17400 [Nitrospira sp. KM1]|uniref:hypothetical protein n=1 Tax=Nitrospira sp. KM1 TaxID=1936990 RepID=UPI0013A753C3|nr:hypothetical protein [Nitrospira sp. KM1]BCA54600.1 hypothetical protein W02_17400 [Nitrospira sp. KM1]